jgi:uncharacterized membrane protein YecN with MAPEG domain
VIAAVYIALCAVLFVALSVRTLNTRRRLRIAVGDGGSPEMLRAMRVHANCAEYVPLGLILLLTAQMQAAPSWLLHLIGATLLVGRLLHAWGVRQVREDFRFRVAGMALTFTSYLIASGWLLLRPLLF